MADRRLRLAAVDLGAESGRVMVGSFDGGRLTLAEGHRFANDPLWLPDGLHWNLPELMSEILLGLGRVAADGPLDGIGVDAWGCDYGLLDAGGRLLGLPYHYRDERSDQAVVDAVHTCVGRDELYRRTGIQTMPINTVFQLSAEAAGPALRDARRIALIPDLIGHWLTGTLANELTVASTTGLLDAVAREWAVDLVARLGLPAVAFGEPVIDPGVELGALLAGHRPRAGDAVGTIVRAVASHDTASAFVAAPLRDERAAVLSSGTWSLLGIELPEPELGPLAAACNLTNERGLDGTVRLLRNVMGLWLLQECRRAWSVAGLECEYERLLGDAAAARPDVALFDPDDPLLLRGGDMPARIAALCAGHDGRPPQAPGELVRSILVSLACKYRLVLDQLAQVTGREIDVVHVVGGGARNDLLCELTADAVQRPVLAGPVEATAHGNLLVQAAALGELSGLDQMREVMRASQPPRVFLPGDPRLAEETYARFQEALEPSAVPDQPLRTAI